MLPMRSAVGRIARAAVISGPAALGGQVALPLRSIAINSGRVRAICISSRVVMPSSFATSSILIIVVFLSVGFVVKRSQGGIYNLRISGCLASIAQSIRVIRGQKNHALFTESLAVFSSVVSWSHLSDSRDKKKPSAISGHVPNAMAAEVADSLTTLDTLPAN